MKKYIRTTHFPDRTPKEFSKEAEDYWIDTEAGFIGHMLSSYKYMTVDEIRREMKEYDEQFPETATPITDEEFEQFLEGLVKYGMAEVIDE